ncbi:CCA-adding enzyme [Candidatus Methanoperedenaceae archaeon GB37]|nr:CCA-adding enzyme [Candidatus Methanoperedenaceae archaeon GB37]
MDMHNYLKKTERLANQIFSPEIQGYWEALKSVALAQETKEIYLVGGVLRDLLLDRPIQDFDIAVKGEARTIASLFAHKIKGHFVVLDEAWETYRVIKGKCVFDFNPFRGPDILSDLIERDFTVNTLALNIFYPKTVLDPFLGRLDIQKRILRMVSHKVFWKDALRILRGLRLAAELDFKLEDETRRLMKRYAPWLKKIPAERIYQEIKRLFPHP